MITKRTTATFTITMMLLVEAASLIPFTKMAVITQVMMKAGKLNAFPP